MINTVQKKPAKRFGPGYFIREQLELREWNQEDLAEITGFSQKHISEVLNNKKPVSIDLARILGEVFDTSAQYWLNLDAAYRIWLQETPTEKEKAADLKAMIYARMPVRDMIKKGWLRPPLHLDDLIAQVLQFWGKTKLDFRDMDEQWVPFLTRKSETFTAFNASYALTWYRKAQIEAEKIQVGPYKRQALEALCEKLSTYTTDRSGVPAFLKDLGVAGVKFMVLPHLEKTYLDGAAFLDKDNPVIVYTGRYPRIDHFWFTLAHELAHVLLHLGAETPFILDDLHNKTQSQVEHEANTLAAQMLKHPQVYEALKDDLHYLTTSKVEECAATYGVHPAIIIGKLAHEGKMHFRNLHLYKENALELIPGVFIH